MLSLEWPVQQTSMERPAVLFLAVNGAERLDIPPLSVYFGS